MYNLLYFAAILQWMGSLSILLVCLYCWRNLNKDLKAVAVYGGLSFFFQLLQFTSGLYFKNRFNNLVANIYAPVELLSLLLIYFYTDKMVKYRLVLAVLSLLLCLFLASVGISNPHTLNGTSETIRDITMIVCSFAYFSLIVNDVSQEQLTQVPMFWINASVLFFFSTTLILSLTMNYILEVLRDDFALFWVFRNFLRVGFCLVLCVGIWKSRKLAR